MSSPHGPIYTNIEVTIGVTVVFNSIESGSELDKLIRQLKIEVEAFDGFVEERLPADRLKERAQIVNATFQAILDWIATRSSSHSLLHSRWVRQSIETAVAILKRYDDAVLEGLGSIARDRLAEMTKKFYDSTAGRHIDNRFLWDLQFYEWLRKRRLLADSRWSSSTAEDFRSFADGELEEFYSKNEDAVLRRMLTCHIEGGRIYLDSPLDQVKENYFVAFRLTPSRMLDINDDS
jgi:hypothetical protein